MAGFHVAPNLAQAGEFTIYDKNANSIEILNLPTTVRGVMIPAYLTTSNISAIVCDQLDAALLIQCQEQNIQVLKGFEGEIEPLVDRIRWNALEDREGETLSVPSPSGCGSGACGGASIDQLMNEMAGSFKDALPFDPTILPKRKKRL